MRKGLPGPLSVNSYRYEAENQYTADHNAYYYPISTTGYNPGNPDAELSNSGAAAHTSGKYMIGSTRAETLQVVGIIFTGTENW